MFKLHSDVYGCTNPGGYQLSPKPAASVVRVLKGRPRARVDDPHAGYLATVPIDMSVAQFFGFQDLWSNVGADWFRMDIWFDNAFRECYCHKTSEFTAAMNRPGRWDVRLPLEIRLTSEGLPS